VVLVSDRSELFKIDNFFISPNRKLTSMKKNYVTPQITELGSLYSVTSGMVLGNYNDMMFGMIMAMGGML
jgi:hypothetical protein